MVIISDSDDNNEEHAVHNLSIKELKALAWQKGVDISKSIEKKDLLMQLHQNIVQRGGPQITVYVKQKWKRQRNGNYQK